ncbi:hypothetical protein VTO42DRAFT_3460 [Malbranchea cinnamomea]
MFGSTKKTEPKSTVAAAKAAIESRSAQAAQESHPARKPVSEEKPAAPAREPKPAVENRVASSTSDGPKTRRQTESDALSDVDSNEQTLANHEFANFDHQSPNVDQPAFVPEDSPVSETFPEKQATSPVTTAPKPVTSSPVSEAGSPTHTATQDRWAQIRKNAAAMQSEGIPKPAPPTEKVEKPSDLPTGHESIEMRAARIRARVAELTRNMESSS